MMAQRDPLGRNVSAAWNTDPAPLVEPKVTWATIGTFIGINVLLYVLELIRDTPLIVTGLPDWLEPPLLAALPTLIALVAGYRARHAPRPDLPPSQR